MPGVQRVRQALHDAYGLHAQVHGSADSRDETARIVEPPLGIVDDPALPVTGDPVAVDESLDRGPPVYPVPVRLGQVPDETNMVVDYEHGPRVGCP